MYQVNISTFWMIFKAILVTLMTADYSNTYWSMVWFTMNTFKIIFWYSDCQGCEFKNFSSECRTWGFSGGSAVRNLPANAGDGGLIPDLGGFHMPWRKLALGRQLLNPCSRAWRLLWLRPQALRSPYSATREASILRSPGNSAESRPHSPQLEKSPKQQGNPAQSKINT